MGNRDLKRNHFFYHGRLYRRPDTWSIAPCSRPLPEGLRTSIPKTRWDNYGVLLRETCRGENGSATAPTIPCGLSLAHGGQSASKSASTGRRSDQ